MKKAFLLFLMASLNCFAQDIYCPESITCTAGTCTLNPDNGYFFISSSYPPFDNAIYYFQSAGAINPNYPYFQDQPPTCNYLTKNGNGSNGYSEITLLPTVKIIAHAPLQNSEWTPFEHNVSWSCHKPDLSADSPQNCPFTVVEASKKK